MKVTTIKNLKKLLNEEFKKRLEGVDRVRRNRRGYEDEETWDDYHDVSEELETEDSDRVRRHFDGYGDDLEETNMITSPMREEDDMIDDPMDDDEREKALGHAVPSEIDVDDTGGDGPGDFAATVAAAYDPLDDKDPKLSLAALMPEDESGAPSEEEEEYVKKHLAKYMKRYGEKHGRSRAYQDAAKMAGSKREATYQEVTPPGFEKTVKGMKDEPGIDNPWALAWWMKKKGYKPGDSEKK